MSKNIQKINVSNLFTENVCNLLSNSYFFIHKIKKATAAAMAFIKND